MGFKGTKGRWGLTKETDDYFYKVKSEKNQGIVISSFECDISERKSNALLISKAPEMLEMLQWFVENFEGVFHEGTETDNKVKEVKQLIKQATEL